MHQKPRDLSAQDSHIAQAASRTAEAEPGEEETQTPASAPLTNPLDDVFGSEGVGQQATPEAPHPTDMSRLQAQHGTSGYREGVSVSREASIQPGFDEGFSLGAALGLRAGQLLGVLEGVSDALASMPSPLTHQRSSTEEEEAAAAAMADTLLTQAREELSTKHIFSPDYWAPDGNWTFDVVRLEDEEGDGDGDGDGEVLFRDVVEAHPLIRKWAVIVDAQVQEWNMQLDILSHEAGPWVGMTGEEQPKSEMAHKTNKALDW